MYNGYCKYNEQQKHGCMYSKYIAAYSAPLESFFLSSIVTVMTDTTVTATAVNRRRRTAAMMATAQPGRPVAGAGGGMTIRNTESNGDCVD